MSVCCVCNKSNSVQESLIQCTKCMFTVHKECYGFHSQLAVVEKWICQRCRYGAGNERCELCPFSDGALKKTDNGKWAHILCAQYIPEVIFGDNYSMEPINLAEVPRPRFQQVCYICDEKGEHIAKRQGACMQCNVQNCVNCFHVTCGQRSNLLVAEDCDNRRIVDYYGFCSLHVKTSQSAAKTSASHSETPNSDSISRGRTTPLEKLPSVDTISSSKLKEVARIVAVINPSAPVLSADPPSIKPVQPKVSSSPIPFEGVHKQTRISINSENQQLQEGTTERNELESTASTTSTAASGPSSPGEPRKRKSSSSTETAESDDVCNEPVVSTLQNMINGSDDKTKLKVTRQNNKTLETSDNDFNDLSDVFNKKMKKKKKCNKSPDSENSDYVPYNERKLNPLYKKSKRTKPKKEGLKIRTKMSFKSKSPKYLANSYLYKSPPHTPVKVQGSKLLTGDKGYSPTTVIAKMMKETKSSVCEEYKPCTGKPIISFDTFFDRLKEMGAQYMISNCKSEKSAKLLKELQGINQINTHLRNQLKAKQSKIEHLKRLNARLSVPYTRPMKVLPAPAPLSDAVAKLLSTIHEPPKFKDDKILAETWLDLETHKKEKEEEEERLRKEKEEAVEEKLTAPPSMSALISKDEDPLPAAAAAAAAAAVTVPTSKSTPGDAVSNVPTSKPAPTLQVQVPTSAAAAEQPQVIIAGDPPMAYTYKDGNIVGYAPEALQASSYSKEYSKALEEYKLLEQKISAAYFEAQRRQYEGLLQHQLQTKLQSSDYLAQAYFTDSHWSNYLYAQQAASGRQLPTLPAPYPSTTLPAAYNTLNSRPSTSRP